LDNASLVISTEIIRILAFEDFIENISSDGLLGQRHLDSRLQIILQHWIFYLNCQNLCVDAVRGVDIVRNGRDQYKPK
jgi:hypothetical protein